MYERIPVWLAYRKREEERLASWFGEEDKSALVLDELQVWSKRQGEAMLSNERNNVNDHYRKSQ